MTTSSPQETATIYQFPLRGRFALDHEPTAGLGQTIGRVIRAAAGSSWYHEEAIREADRSRKN